VTAAERRTYPVPYGHHVYVVSDLSLSPTTDVASRPVQELMNLLGDIDDAAVVVVAGNLFHPHPEVSLARHIEMTFAALPSVRDALQRFCAIESRRLFVLPGSDDLDLRDHEDAQSALRALGICIASDLVLQVATASGVQDLAVAAGTYDLNVDPVNRTDVADAARGYGFRSSLSWRSTSGVSSRRSPTTSPNTTTACTCCTRATSGSTSSSSWY
jgi:hypothetical protein